jgi:hypothetical protein
MEQEPSSQPYILLDPDPAIPGITLKVGTALGHGATGAARPRGRSLLPAAHATLTSPPRGTATDTRRGDNKESASHLRGTTLAPTSEAKPGAVSATRKARPSRSHSTIGFSRDAQRDVEVPKAAVPHGCVSESG